MPEDNEDLLALLNAHGQQFLSSFSSPGSTSKKRMGTSTAGRAPSLKRARLDSDDSDEGEWTGFGGNASSEEEYGESGDEGGEGLIEGALDDGYTAGASSLQPEIVVFSDSRDTAAPRPTKSQSKAFMSSKVSKLRADDSSGPSFTQQSKKEDGDDDRTNVQNDAALHKLVHTRLLSGSLDPSLNLTSAQRKKALQGRVLELSGVAKLGKGEKAVRNKEHARASKSVRDGIDDKRVERKGKALTEAKDMGNWHPTIKKLLADEDDPSRTRKREKGLGMGVGKFEGGMLKLSRREMFSVNGPTDRTSSRGGRGRGRGKGGKK
ncbi:hypothetical protein PENSPDRAFT_586468 [Peniophora sp. CONT]|nr:hypothetical protein PENSPDRAFT_586468 [Peniophora sp. CONT]